MRPIKTLLIGVAALCLPLCLLGCVGNGTRQPPTIHDTHVIDATRAQYVDVPPNLLQHPKLPPLPAPAVVDADKCVNGCYSNDQVRAAIDAALDTLGRCYDQLDAIGVLSGKAVQSNTPPKQ